MPGRPFQKGNKLAKGGARPGAGAYSDLHRAQCRKLVEDLGIREFFGKVSKGEKVDFFTTIAGKVVPVPASIRNRLLAGITLIEQGYGKAPGEITHKFDRTIVLEFQNALTRIFQRHLPKLCKSCGTHLQMPPELAKEIMALSSIFDRALEESNAAATR